MLSDVEGLALFSEIIPCNRCLTTALNILVPGVCVCDRSSFSVIEGISWFGAGIRLHRAVVAAARSSPDRCLAMRWTPQYKIFSITGVEYYYYIYIDIDQCGNKYIIYD